MSVVFTVEVADKHTSAFQVLIEGLQAAGFALAIVGVEEVSCEGMDPDA